MKKYCQLITDKRLKSLTANARQAPRKRMNDNLHEQNDVVQKFLNAIEPGSYVRPHRHSMPPRAECFVVLKGKFRVFIFKEDGSVKETLLLDGKKNIAIDIAPGVWLTVLSLQKNGVFFEIKEGPYQPTTDKDFAPWAPAEGDPGVKEYIQTLLKNR